MTIITTFVKPPIPFTDWDWAATQEGYEPGDLVGYGATEQDAIDDLNKQIKDDQS